MSTKKLRSGEEVHADTYYKLLDWKDTHMDLFEKFCFSMGCSRSINDFSPTQYAEFTIFTLKNGRPNK